MTATDTRTVLAVDLDLVCRHQHIVCDRCKRGLERRQQVADEATPPRPLGEHGCCGAWIYRAGWRPL